MYITLLQRSLHPNLRVNDADTPYHSTNTRIWKCRGFTLLMIPTLRGTTFLQIMIPDRHSFMTTYEISISYRIHSLRFPPKMAEEPYPESIATVFCFLLRLEKSLALKGVLRKHLFGALNHVLLFDVYMLGIGACSARLFAEPGAAMEQHGTEAQLHFSLDLPGSLREAMAGYVRSDDMKHAMDIV